MIADAELVRRVLDGERDAYGMLVTRHQDVLYRHARGMGIDHDTSLDLVQDAFVKGYTSLASCHEPAHFRAWVFRILRNLCLDHLKNVRRLSVPLSSVPETDVMTTDDAAKSELTHALQSALDKLPQSMREAFLLKHDAGYTYEELAEMTNTTPSAVKMRVHRARETLRDFLVAHGVRAA